MRQVCKTLGERAALQLLQLLFAGGVEYGFSQDLRQSRFSIDNGLCQWTIGAFELAVAFAEQCGSFALGNTRQCLAQFACATVHA
ncbi:hypothetical protein D3C72_2203890 [compost metagenome]